MRCEQCNRYHRDFVPCGADVLTKQAPDCCRGDPFHARMEVLEKRDSGPRTWFNIKRCRECGTTWGFRYQFDDGTGRDNDAWVIAPATKGFPYYEEVEASPP